jgi:UDP-3-O-[3-hydroxymyristoyl] glucosamine N-acyltransferase
MKNNVYPVFDHTIIGNNVIIQHNNTIGSDGFGYSKNENGELERFPHIGGVIIEDFVEIGSNTCIDKGTLGNTVIKKGTKIDNLVHIAHNVEIGENCYIVANAMIGGSTKIARNTWVSPSTSLRDGIEIGEGSTLGMGAVLVKNQPAKSVWAGNPAKDLKEIIKHNKSVEDLLVNYQKFKF